MSLLKRHSRVQRFRRTEVRSLAAAASSPRYVRRGRPQTRALGAVRRGRERIKNELTKRDRVPVVNMQHQFGTMTC
jgi:hypothetical protein